MSDGVPVSLVCVGLLGAAVDDGGLLERAFSEACATQGVVPGTAAYARAMVTVHQSLGQPPVEVFRTLFPGGQGRAEAAALSFERSFRFAVDRSGLRAEPGAAEALGELRDSGVKTCLITALSRPLLAVTLDAVGWWRKADLVLCQEDVSRGCPWPDLVLTAMLRLGAGDVREMGFAGCTSSGVLCGKRAGASLVAGVLRGGHTEDRLRKAGATHVIGSLSELPGLVAADGAARPVSSSASAPVARVPLEHRSAGL
ncbi:MAG TPA: HAD family hydrolase [Streptosporangiaceae bacterium]|nr:HAD family hydrolase [Streptosporangiaceae bacterium]HEV2451247.1 HAD family hydrolase [Streptosporangiaceae bacterium]